VDAKKGLQLKELPYLLCLQLKRFDFDYSTGERCKLNNRVSFPLTLDMKKWLPSEKKEEKKKDEKPLESNNNTTQKPQEETPKEGKKEEVKKEEEESSYVYELFSILIASGGALGGHYFTFVKSFETGKWYNFNDSRYEFFSEISF
jgi:ubiquitin carboxyl-terminal hydrolase 47